jgi:hypothetical protein
MTSTRLQKTQHKNAKKQIPTTTNSRTMRPGQRSQIFLKIRYTTMGFQQCPNQRWRRMEGSLQDEHGPIQTNSDVLWPNKLTSNLPSNDGQNTPNITRWRDSSGLYRRHPHILDGRRIPLKDNRTIIQDLKG